MNARDVIAERLERYDLIADYEDEHHRPGWRIALKMADSVLDAICPPGSRVVVDHTPKECPTCGGTGDVQFAAPDDCSACGGSGVVEATTIHGLEATSTDRDGVLCDELGRVLTDQTVPLFRAVALPEDGQ